MLTFSKRSGLFNSSIILSAICFGSLDLSKKPVSPSLIISGIAPTGVASTGVPQAIASKILFGNPSVNDGRKSKNVDTGFK